MSTLAARKIEVAEYLKFLARIELASSAVVAQKGRRGRPFVPDTRTKCILRANFFLIFYNLIEFAISGQLSALFGKIRAEGATYRDVNASFREYWVQDRLMKNFKDFAPPQTHLDAVSRLLDQVVEGQPIIIQGKARMVSGNLDADQIRKICHTLGISSKVSKYSSGGIDLETVVQKRNSLAHGEESFEEVGRDYTLPQLKEMSRKSLSFLECIVANFEKHVATRAFRA